MKNYEPHIVGKKTLDVRKSMDVSDNKQQNPHIDYIDQAVEVLNRIHAADPSVLPALIEYRVPCNEELAGDKTVQVGMIAGTENDEETKFEVGFLGILNGIFGIDENGWGYIVLENTKIHGLRFVRNVGQYHPDSRKH